MICLFFFWILLSAMLSKKVNFFSILIFLEVLVLVVFLGSLSVLSYEGSSVSCYLLVMYLCFGVCEAVVGLSLLVSAARSVAFYSTDSFTILKI